MKHLLLLALVSGLAFGQTFEVARIRQADPINIQALAANRGAISLGNIGMKVNGSQVNFGYMSLRDLIVAAYEVKVTQVKAPEWIAQQRYDISALMPEGTDQKQVPAMLRALLKERFKLDAHKDSTEQMVLALEVAKDGHKMKAAAPLDANAAPAVSDPKAGRFSTGGAVISNSANGATKLTMGQDGRMHMEVERMTMQQLADELTPLSEFPVVDRTGLTGAFQVALDFSRADILNGARKTGAMSGVALPAGVGAPQGMPAGLGASDPGGDMSSTVAKLGLRLEKIKVAMDSVTVESAEKNPTEN